MNPASTRRPVTFRRQVASRAIPGLRLAEVSYAGGHRQPQHAHPVSTISLVLGGSLEERAARSAHAAAAGFVVIKPAGVEHSDVFGAQGARMLQLACDENTAAAAGPWLPLWQRYRWLERGPGATAVLRLFRQLADEAENFELAVEEALCELAAVVDSHAATATRPARPKWLTRVVERLVEPAAAPPRISELANSAGVHPVHLARVFRRAFGCTMSRYARRQRVAAACLRLAASDAPLAVIALDAGFADQAHLCRAFRAEMGVTPAAYRRSVRGA